MAYAGRMFGLFNIDKPPGPTSHDIVVRARRLLPRKTKVGHAGTLDPFAGGVLVVCVGPATRLADYVQAAPKRYLAEITLGAISTTHDSEGEIIATAGAAAPAEGDIRRTLGAFVGEVQQVPPAHSAVHVDGRRAYELARKGQAVELPARTVSIHAIELVRFDWPVLEIDVRCGSGTYIRALARDLGAKLDTGGYCSKLTRTEVGGFHLADATAIADLEPARDLLSPLTALEGLARVTVDEAGARKLAMGQTAPLPAGTAAAPPGEIAVVDGGGRLLALAQVRGDGPQLQPVKVFRGAN